MDGFVKRLDWYRRVPKDLTEASLHGALVSVSTILIACYLLISNLIEYHTLHTRSEMYVDSDRGNKLKINLDIVFPKVPCPALSLDAQDVMGSHELSTGGMLHKVALSKTGEVLEKEEVHGNHMTESGFHGLSRHNWNLLHDHDKDRLKEKLLQQEGCRLQGSLEVNRVPGNIHISTSSGILFNGMPFPTLGGDMDDIFGRGPWRGTGTDSADKKNKAASSSSASPSGKNKKTNEELFAELSEGEKVQRLQNLDLEHEVLHLSFGDDQDVSWVRDNFQASGILSPLDGLKRTVDRKKFSSLPHWRTHMSAGISIMMTSDHDSESSSSTSSTTLAGETSTSSSSATATIDRVNTVPAATIFEYYCNVVPTTYERESGELRHVYQFTANGNTLQNTHAPGLYVRYGISPVTVKFVEDRVPFFTFFVQTLAIVGGLFTVAGLLESALHRGIQTVQRKLELGKLT
ncbi:unnamed protein product [Amoebophrya sp. A25]|nr:unnamed protein product [Amoebophrya sp. A25]|eukprot:GSA25T00021946001.1